MKHIFDACVVFGFLVAIGSAGGSDCGTLELGKAALLCMGGLLAAFVGIAGLNILKKREEN